MEWLLPVLMVLVLLGLIFSGYPVAFCLGGTAVVFAVIGISLGEFSLMRMNSSYVRIRGLMSNDVLLAIPFFIFMSPPPPAWSAPRWSPWAPSRCR